jgi:hypothetical protein
MVGKSIPIKDNSIIGEMVRDCSEEQKDLSDSGFQHRKWEHNS